MFKNYSCAVLPMEIIFIIGASQALFLSILTFNKKDKKDSDYILAVWLAFIAIHLLDIFLFKTGYSFNHPHLLGIGACFPILQGPFLYVYTLTMLNGKNKLRPVYLLHGLPFLVFTIYFMFNFYFLSGPKKIEYIHLQENNPYPVISLLNILILVIGPLYIILTFKRLRKHTRSIKDNFSYTHGINLNWLKYLLIGLGFIWFMVVFANLMVKVFLISDNLSENIIYLSVTLAVFFLGFFGIRQQAIYSDKDFSEETKKSSIESWRIPDDSKDNADDLKKDRLNRKYESLLNYFESRKPYLNSRLIIKDVSDELNIPVNQLSYIINSQTGKSFFSFVNRYRIEEFKSRFADPQNKYFTIMAIAYESGFNSKSSFNRIFKEFMGITPSEFFRSNT